MTPRDVESSMDDPVLRFLRCFPTVRLRVLPSRINFYISFEPWFVLERFQNHPDFVDRMRCFLEANVFPNKIIRQQIRLINCMDLATSF